MLLEIIFSSPWRSLNGLLQRLTCLLSSMLLEAISIYHVRCHYLPFLRRSSWIGGFAFAPTTYFLPCVMWLAIYKPRRFSLSWWCNWICIAFGLCLMILSPRTINFTHKSSSQAKKRYRVNANAILLDKGKPVMLMMLLMLIVDETICDSGHIYVVFGMLRVLRHCCVCGERNSGYKSN
ncbi:hypothetical protein ACB092_01G285300 [Castanea dentata]